MAELACAEEPRFEVSRLEENTERSYSIDTIEKVRAGLNPTDRLYFLIGADAFAELGTWHRWQDIVAAVIFIVVSRPGNGYRVPEGARLERLENLDLPISSSEIRDALARGKPVTDVPEQVLRYILQHRLYGVPAHG
jgi:nicotinate-nucleotide adenylyltransferase